MRLLVNLFSQVEAMGDWRYSELHCGTVGLRV